MPNAAQHCRKAENNRQFLATISRDDYPDWVVVVAFYTAVHRVEQLRAALGDGHSISHEERLRYVQHNHPDIHSPYHLLQNASLLARYQSRGDFFAQFQPEDIDPRFIAGCLDVIEAYVVAHLPTAT